MKKANMNTERYIEEMKESARKLAMKCDVASDFHHRLLDKYKYDYMEVEVDADGNYKTNEEGNYVYRDKTENDWNYEEAMIAREIVKVIEKAIESYCFLD